MVNASGDGGPGTGAPGTGAPGTERARRRVRLTTGSVALLLSAAAGAFVLRNVMASAHRQIGWAYASIVAAALLLPLADRLDRHLPRWVALLVTMLGLSLTALVVSAGVVVNLRDGFDTLALQAPKAAAVVEARYEVARDFRLAERVRSLIEQFEQPSAGAAVSQAVGTAGTYFVCGILTLFFLVYGPKMLRDSFGQVRDPLRRRRVEMVVMRTLDVGRRYVIAAFGQAVAVGLAVGLLSWLLDLPAPFVLGTIAGAIGTLPTLGIVAGGLPVLLLAVGLNGWRDAAIVALLLLLLQAVEIQVVRRRVDQATVHLGPALPAIVALMGYELYGIGGAAYGAVGLVFLIGWLDTIGDRASPGSTTPEGSE